ncbi:tRNA (guanosine(37)-N1)-methyltransferase TrmD [Cytophagaceae bacterium AH-315-L13]|nr:tRNA (guanosine(37)-N1)-methyltransferase TrmD [Cytophagaceae bacterium AH-315-L13]
MRIDIITLLPKLIESPFDHSILQRAKDKGLVEINIHDLREYGVGNQKQVDDYSYGGGAGMVLMIEPIVNCINKLKENIVYDEIIYMSPDGEQFDQKMANNYSLKKNLIVLCGHYKGVDERVREHFITKEISIGNYVLSGGELAAAVFVDAVVRLIPGVLSDESSALTDSFQDDLIAPPMYTRPAEYQEMKVPEILLSGDAAKIEEWRYQQSLERTKDRRPDLLNE